MSAKDQTRYLLDEIKSEHYKFKQNFKLKHAVQVVYLATQLDRVDLTDDEVVPMHNEILKVLETELKEVKTYLRKLIH